MKSWVIAGVVFITLISAVIVVGHKMSVKANAVLDDCELTELRVLGYQGRVHKVYDCGERHEESSN